MGRAPTELGQLPWTEPEGQAVTFPRVHLFPGLREILDSGVHEGHELRTRLLLSRMDLTTVCHSP